MSVVFSILQSLVVIVIIGVALHYSNKRLGAYFATRPHMKMRYQLIQIAGVLVAILLVLVFLPYDQTLKVQVLKVYGLVFSATIALSSTTLVGNVMAGLMLKAIDSCKPGDYVTVGDYFGRISEMDLLHTEIQTEERDLTTLPNLYLVTHPVRVMRSSGTLLSVEVSLGYDVPRQVVEELLIAAAIEAGLDKPYVQIRNLGDFSVTYQVSALLSEVNRLLERRRELRARTMDSLHAAGIEIVSPTFMNTRALAKGKTFIAEPVNRPDSDNDQPSLDSMAFDKAAKAASVSKLRETLADTESRLQICDEIIGKPPSDRAKEAAESEKAELETRVERLTSLIARKEEKISKD